MAELARGGMGVIHLAEARGPGGFEKLVVVKELKHELADDAVYTAMFLDEARLAARLNHRHIVQTHEVGFEGGRYFMALELLEGGTLHQIRTKLGLRALPPNLAVRALAAVLDALEHAHSLTDEDGYALGIVHRDVSPQNVFLTFDGDVKLIDFGVAKSADRQGVTRVGVVKGSVPYMSPDHVDGTTIDRRADVFAVGVILREMLVGERLWGGADDFTVLRRLIARDLPALPELSAIPAALRAIVLRATAPQRKDRYASAAAMRDALEGYLREADPRGSLSDLGPWLGKALAAERAAFRALTRRGARAGRAQVWLPSSDLVTRVSGPPQPAAAPARVASRLRMPLTGLLFAVALVLAGFGLIHPSRGAALIERTPRSAEDLAPSTLVTTLAVTSLEPAAAEDVATATETATAERTASAPAVPAAVLREALPPNPYE